MLRGVPSIRRPWSSSNSDRIREDRKYCGGCHPDDPSRTGRLSCQHHELGTNGGGYYGANSAYPFQNPNPASDIFQIFLMLLIPTALCFVYGQMLGRRKEARPILWGAYSLFAIDLLLAFIPNYTLGRGMEVRFGGFFSTFWTVVTTAVTTGSVNSSLFGNHPLVILSAFMGMLIQSSPGGKGVGVMYMVMYVVITVFIVGLMSGRTPEYLGMK